MLNINNFRLIANAAIKKIVENGAGYYGWVNAPIVDGEKITHTSGWGDQQKTKEVSPTEALEIMSQKINGAYGERFVMSLGLIAALIKNGYSVRFVQFQAEEGVPFDAKGWTVMIIETMPVFHISPDDLRLEDVKGLVEILPDNSVSEVSWKNTNKVGEFTALLAGSIESDLDLVQIAQENS